MPAVALLGPRQVGKTTLAQVVGARTKSVYLDLESPIDREKLADTVSYLSLHEDELVIVDEVQRMPELFTTLRGLIDQGRRRGKKSGRFLLLGSASVDLLRQSESLAGRISYIGSGSSTRSKCRPRIKPFCGFVAAFRRAFWQAKQPKACAGAPTLSEPIWSGTFRSLAREFRRRLWGASGPCLPMSRAACSTQLNWPAALRWTARRSRAIWTCSWI
jgi:hypothetical protein